MEQNEVCGRYYEQPKNNSGGFRYIQDNMRRNGSGLGRLLQESWRKELIADCFPDPTAAVFPYFPNLFPNSLSGIPIIPNIY